MLRRRLFAYSIMFTAGIVSGYLFFECGKYLMAVVMLLGIAYVASVIDLEYKPDKTDQERRIIIVFIILGFVVFTVSFIRMNGIVRDDSGKMVRPEEVGSITGLITDISEKSSDNGNYFRIVIKPLSHQFHGKVQLNYYSELDTDYINYLGEIVTLYGELREPAGVENPGCFNYRSYLYSRGIRFTYSCKYMKVQDNNLNGCESMYWAYRRKMMQVRDIFLDKFDDETRPIIKGILFGDKSEIDEDTLEEFNNNSTGHILAVSGLHVGFLFALLRILTRKKRNGLTTVLIIAVIVMYGEMTGWSPSAARAVVVLSISILALHARRTPDLLTSVSAAALIILTANPYNIVSSGFQLSFIALLGMCFLSPVLEYYIGEYLSVLVGIQLVIAPMIAYSYCSFNISSMLVNVPIVLIASLLVPICILGLTCLLYAGCLPNLLIHMIEGLTSLLISVNSKLNMDSIYVTDIKGLTAGMLVAYYLVLFFITSEWTRIKLIRQEYRTILNTGKYLLIPIVCICIATYNPFLNDEIVFVNVGQGDCTHIRYHATNIMIDGGGNQYTNIGKNTLRPYLLHNNVGNIDLALITHEHTDHFKGIQELSQIYPIKHLEQGYINNNYRISNELWIESIWPEEYVLRNNDTANENELNTVYIIHYDNTKVMITGDLTAEDEQKIVERYRGTDTLDCDVLKVGHHGSKTSTSEEFLDAVTPAIAIISVGAHNSYSHPHNDTLEKLARRGIMTYRTDLNGAIGIDIRGIVLKKIFCTRGQSLKVDTIR